MTLTPTKLRHWNGLRCRLKREIKTKGGLVAHVGALGVVYSGGAKASFQVQQCGFCKLSFFVMGLAFVELPRLFEILERVEPPLEARSRR